MLEALLASAGLAACVLLFGVLSSPRGEFDSDVRVKLVILTLCGVIALYLAVRIVHWARETPIPFLMVVRLAI